MTLNQRIRSDLEKKILTGEWPPGYHIPFEHQLVDHYKCSRMTVNKVMSALAASGLIERRQKVGSFVSRPKVLSAVLEIHDTKSEVEARGLHYDYKLLNSRRREATKAEQNELSLPPETEVLALRCLHLANSEPFALEERLINVSVVPHAIEVDFSIHPPSTWLLSYIPWTQAEHHVWATNADSAVAKALKIPEQTACLVVKRRTWRSDETVTTVRLTFPGHSYSLIARFSPTS